MEKVQEQTQEQVQRKGNILTQMAVISDLLEKVNLDSEKTSVAFMLNSYDFNRLYKYFTLKAHIKLDEIIETFSVKIGITNYTFTLSKSNV